MGRVELAQGSTEVAPAGLKSLELISYANVVIDKDSLPFERYEKKQYELIRQYEWKFKAVPDDGSLQGSEEYWLEWYSIRDKIRLLTRKQLVGLMDMWSKVRPGYDVIDICKACY